MAKDQMFQKDLNKILHGAPIYTGGDTVTIMKDATSLAKASRNWLKKWIHKRWGVEFEK